MQSAFKHVSLILCKRIQGVHVQRMTASTYGKSSLLLSPSEATRMLRKNESTIDLESKCLIKFYEVNHLGANNPAEDRQAQAKCLSNDAYLFGVFDGHGGYQCSDTISQRLFDYIALNFLSPKQLEDMIKWSLDNKNYPLWFAYYSPYEDSRIPKMKEIHKMSLTNYAEELLTMNVLEGSNDSGTNIEAILRNAFLKLDRDIIVEALPSPGQPIDRDTLDIAMSGSCACIAFLKDKDLWVKSIRDLSYHPG
jgi:pyruvate dehydrogenase phosphatase